MVGTIIHGHGRWYAKLAAVSALCGAAMELFMIQTGFYQKVTAIEAERRAELQALKEGVHEMTQVDLRKNE
ncbi:hypothetical protein O6H91_09G082300 [Diphasiastrum complanatum]|uniref:Uncharacterized protein n=1 Tax=Diphasiastrum complanatum TaxID=34168 RepID=A0ACC2CRE4_DIPCM|nr:hypothetical protein O6H91_09G082300 [Diphasiastrum complanatum]